MREIYYNQKLRITFYQKNNFKVTCKNTKPMRSSLKLQYCYTVYTVQYTIIYNSISTLFNNWVGALVYNNKFIFILLPIDRTVHGIINK